MVSEREKTETKIENSVKTRKEGNRRTVWIWPKQKIPSLKKAQVSKLLLLRAKNETNMKTIFSQYLNQRKWLKSSKNFALKKFYES